MTYTERVKEFTETWQATGAVYQAALLIPDVVDDEYFEHQKPKLERYKCKKYERRNVVSPDEIEEALSKVVKERVSRSPFWTYTKRKKEFIEKHRADIAAELIASLEKEENEKEKEFNENEKCIKKQKDLEFKRKYESELKEYNNFFNPTQEWLSQKFEEYFSKITKKWKVFLPSGSFVNVDRDGKGGNMYSCNIQVNNLTEFHVHFSHKISVTSAGNLSRRLKTDKQLEEEYAQNVCALAFVHAVCLFNVCLDVKEVLVSCYVNCSDPATGNECIQYLYSVVVPRELVRSFKMENLNAVAALMSLDGNADIRNERDIYFVEPLQWDLENGSVTDGMDEEEIDVDFRCLNVELSFPPKYKIASTLLDSFINQTQAICKSKVMELGICSDDFDADNYAWGLCNLVYVLSLLRADEKLFQVQNNKKMMAELKKFFGGSAYAMREIKKMIDDNVLVRIKNGEEDVPVNRLVLLMLQKAFDFDKE